MSRKVFKTMKSYNKRFIHESGRIGYFVLWLFGAPAGLLILLWAILGDNIFGRG
jgi:hypothetical protein